MCKNSVYRFRDRKECDKKLSKKKNNFEGKCIQQKEEHSYQT